MRRYISVMLLAPIFLYAHFQMILPEKDIIEKRGESEISLHLIFCHPFEGDVMNMEQPLKFGVLIRGTQRKNLLDILKEYRIDGKLAWKTFHRIKRPGDYVFYVEPKPYWEPAEGKFIIHYTKVIVNAFGLEEGWDAEVGLKAEIIPLTRPYGLYTGNVFRGLVKVNGKPAPFIPVEIEYYNKDKKYKAPAGPFVTQVIKTDANGVFSYAMPKAGWWGFAALTEAEKKMKNPEDSKEYPVEIGAVIWVRVEDMR